MTDTKPSLYYSLTSQWTASLYTAAISMGLTFIMGRFLGPYEFGVYSYILTLASLFFIIQDGGFKTLIFREKTLPTFTFIEKYDSSLFSMAYGHALTCTVAGIVFCLIIPLFHYRAGIILAFICFFFQAFINFISAELRADGKFPEEAVWQMVVRTTGAVGIILVLCFAHNAPWMIFAGWSLGLLSALYLSPIKITRPFLGMFGYCGSRHNYNNYNECSNSYEIHRACMAFMIINAATTVYYRCDIILLQYLTHDSTQVGYYAAAYRFLDGIVLLTSPVGVIWFRKLRLVWKDKKPFFLEVVKLSLIMAGASALILLVGITFDKWLILLTFGKNYSPTIHILPFLLGSLIFILPNTILTQAIIAQNGEIIYAGIAGFAALFNITLNFILIPEFGGIGAAWATIATEAVLGLGLITILKFKYSKL